ncbi:hypothetical protein, partial [Nocardia cyriacigeorgica]|uniref:hypothetical protein n=1 Tax=Nocardia cyriacigeorgica TaxID=135487 RepID=UPI0030DC9C82
MPTKSKSPVVRAKTTRDNPSTIKLPKKAPTVRHFKVGDRVLFTYGKREVEGTVTSTFGDRVHVDMHFV